MKGQVFPSLRSPAIAWAMSTTATPARTAAPMLQTWRAAVSHLQAVAAPGVLAFVWYAVTSVWRHVRFGSGSWDMGCYVHNLYLLAYGKPPVSSVLGDVAFWGGTNHFMPSLVLAAPLAWTGSTSSLLVLQAALVASTVVPLALLAAHLQVPPLATAVVAGVFLVHPSTQAMIAFDVHEIAPVPLLLLAALWAAATQRTAIFVLALVVMAGTKESAILYAAATAVAVAGTAATATGPRRVAAAMAAALVAWLFESKAQGEFKPGAGAGPHRRSGRSSGASVVLPHPAGAGAQRVALRRAES